MQRMGYGKDYKYAITTRSTLWNSSTCLKSYRASGTTSPRRRASKKEILARLKAWWAKEKGRK